jgi:hypothetical protein
MAAEAMAAAMEVAVMVAEELEAETEAATEAAATVVVAPGAATAAAAMVVAVTVAEKAAAVRAGATAARRSPRPHSIGLHATLPQGRKRKSQCCRQWPRHDAPWRWRAHIPPIPTQTRRRARTRCSG